MNEYKPGQGIMVRKSKYKITRVLSVWEVVSPMCQSEKGVEGGVTDWIGQWT